MLKFKRLIEGSVVPEKANKGDAGLDLVATSFERLSTNQVKYGTGLAVEIPEGHVGLLFPRSSIHKKSMNLANSVGVIDSGYRGEICAIFNTTSSIMDGDNIYSIGDRICQLVIIKLPTLEVEEVKELSDTERGEGGFGSSGS